jgi:hypothetical protein
VIVRTHEAGNNTLTGGGRTLYCSHSASALCFNPPYRLIPTPAVTPCPCVCMQVTVLECIREAGKKILMSGGSRCHCSHTASALRFNFTDLPPTAVITLCPRVCMQVTVLERTRETARRYSRAAAAGATAVTLPILFYAPKPHFTPNTPRVCR